MVNDMNYYPITRQQNFRLVQNETNCRRHFKVHLKMENMNHKG